MLLQMNRQHATHWVRILIDIELTQPQTGWVRNADPLGGVVLPHETRPPTCEIVK